MSRLPIFVLAFLLLFGWLPAISVAQDPQPNGIDRIYEQLAKTQKRLREDYEALRMRMRLTAHAEGTPQEKERLKKAVALMDELGIGNEMDKLEKLIEDKAINAAMAKAASISEMIRQVLLVLDGIDPDWQPDERIPTLQEKLEQLKRLSELQSELKDQTDELSKKPELSETDQQKLDRLKDRQREIQREVEELRDDLPDEAKPALDRAIERMDQALEQLQQENLDGAELRQQEAKENLDEAQRQAENELRKYRDKENENLLIHVERELEKIRKEQKNINGSTLETQTKADSGERVGRREWRTVYSDQLQNKKEADNLAEKLIHGNVPIFGRVMEGVSRDMEKAAHLLRRGDGGPFTQSIQEDVLQRLDDLLDALRQERQRRQNEGGDPPQQTNPDGSSPEPRLVPLPAELGILLKRQEYLRKKHERFVERFPDVTERSKMTDAQRRIYERLSQEQGENAGYLDSLLDSLFNRE